jgi:hypothetical protein
MRGEFSNFEIAGVYVRRLYNNNAMKSAPASATCSERVGAVDGRGAIIHPVKIYCSFHDGYLKNDQYSSFWETGISWNVMGL